MTVAGRIPGKAIYKMEGNLLVREGVILESRLVREWKRARLGGGKI
jgi:hypothetical protein